MISEMASGNIEKFKFSHQIIYKKHLDFFLDQLGSFQTLAQQNIRLNHENKHLKTILNSKRHKLVDKIFKFLKL